MLFPMILCMLSSLHARTCAPLGEEGDVGTRPPVLDG